MTYHDYAKFYAVSGQQWLGLHLLSMLQRWLDQHDWHGVDVVDLGCGTGDVAVALSLAGYHVTAIDRSPAMLDRAKRHAQIHGVHVNWIEHDLTTWNAPQSADLILSLYDTLNYIVEPAALQRTFHTIAQTLRPNGIVVFDLNTPLEYATWIERSTVTADHDDLFIYNVLDYNEETQIATGRIVWFERMASGWRRGEETHQQRAHSDADITQWLNDAGLAVIARLTIDGAPADLATATRVVYVGMKHDAGKNW